MGKQGDADEKEQELEGQQKLEQLVTLCAKERRIAGDGPA